MKPSYWLTQSSTEPLWPEIEWNRPEQKTRAGKLLIIGGNLHGFRSVADAYQEATDLGAGTIRALVPDKLKPLLPPAAIDTVFVPSTKPGSMSREAADQVHTGLGWADHALLIGDAGRNSETAIVYESLLSSHTPLTITRDAVDMLRPVSATLLERPHTTLVLSFAQLQKLLQNAYYPRIINFSMSVMNLVETLHKVTITFPSTLVTFHQDHLLVAHGGRVVTTSFTDPMMIWRGSVATKAACYQLWSPSKPLEAIATSICLPSNS